MAWTGIRWKFYNHSRHKSRLRVVPFLSEGSSEHPKDCSKSRKTRNLTLESTEVRQSTYIRSQEKILPERHPVECCTVDCSNFDSSLCETIVLPSMLQYIAFILLLYDSENRCMINNLLSVFTTMDMSFPPLVCFYLRSSTLETPNRLSDRRC